MSWTAHKYSYSLHKGHIPPGQYVCHTCDNKLCVNPDHLFLGTPSDNMQDMLSKSRQKKTKMSMDIVYKILEDTRRQWEIAQEHGISQSQVSKLKRRYHLTT